jgi:hypothetical protein
MFGKEVLTGTNVRYLSRQEDVLRILNPPKDLQMTVRILRRFQFRISPSPMEALNLPNSLESSPRA